MIHAITVLLATILGIFGTNKPGAMPPPIADLVNATGSTGVSGPTGISGPTGASGATGSSGATGETGASGVSGPSGPSGATGASSALGPTGATHPDTTRVPAYNTSSDKLMPANIPIVAIDHSPSLDYTTGATGAAAELRQNNGKGPKNK